MSFPCVNYSTKPAKKPVFSRVLAVFLLLNHAHSCHWFVRPGLVNLQALHQPTALLRRQLSHLFSVPRPLEAPVLQPFVQQHKAVTFPVQRFIRSHRLPQNRNSVLVNGSSWNWLCTNAASPSIPLRKSVYPQAMYTFSAPVKSLSMILPPGTAPAAYSDPHPCKPESARC